MPSLPTITLGSLEVSRLIVGGNTISGFSHQNTERSRQMVEYFTVERIKAHWRDCESRGITALIARADAFIMRVLAEYWREGGKMRWIAQTAPEHRNAVANIKLAAGAGASAIYVHGGDADVMMEENRQEELRERIDTIRSLGLPVGMAAHNPEWHLKAQSLGLPLDFHMVCMYNLTGYRGRKDVEPKEEFDPADRAAALGALRHLDQPCIAYKILGAGRLTIQQALTDVAPALKPKDGVLIGMFPPDRPDIVAENVAAVAGI